MKFVISMLAMIFIVGLSSCLFAQDSDTTFWERDVSQGGGYPLAVSIADNGDMFALTDTILYRSIDKGNMWKQVKSLYKGNGPLYFNTGLCAYSAKHIIVADDNGIYRSADRGNSWQMLPFPVNVSTNHTEVIKPEVYITRTIKDIICVNESQIAVFIKVNYWSGTRNLDSILTTVYLTTDNATTWDSVTSLPIYLESVTFEKEHQTILAVGSFPFLKNAAIMQSSDSGKTWQTLPNSLPSWVNYATMFDRRHYLVLTNSQGMYRSVDSGRTWERSLSPALVMSGLHQYKDILLAGTRQYVYSSSDSGRSWSNPYSISGASSFNFITSFEGNVFLRTGNGLYRDSAFPSVFARISNDFVPNTTWDVEVLAPSMVLSSYLGGLSVSNDRGTTWKKTRINSYDVRAIGFSSKGTLFAATIDYFDNERSPHKPTWRSTDNGETWHEIFAKDTNGNQYPFFAQCFLPVDDTIYAGFEFKGVGRSTDEGVTWTFGKNLPPYIDGASTHSFCRTHSGAILAGKDEVIRRTTDGGKTFTISLNLDHNNFASVYSIIQSPKTGRIFAGAGWCQNDTSWYCSDDDGLTWRGLSLQSISQYFCAGWLAADSLGNIYADPRYRSTDNGETWEYIGSGLPDEPDITSFVVAPDGRLYVGLQNGGLYRSRKRFPPVAVQEEPPPATLELHIIPNPADGILRWSIPDGTATIINVMGQKMMELPASAQAVDVSGLAAGVYVLTVRTATGVVSRTFVKE